VKHKRRIFHENLDGESVVLSPEESHHISKVLRLRTGDKLVIFNGKGASRPARVGETGKREVEIVFAGPEVMQEPPVPSIMLAVAPPKGQRMDTLVQMAQEIGLDELIPIITDNSVQQDFSENRYARWRRIALAAAKQSGNNYVLNIKPAMDFDDLLKNIEPWDMRLVCHTGPDCQRLHDYLKEKTRPEKILLGIGPEGGFSEREIKSAKDAGCATVKLPAATLRVETAAVFVLSAICNQLDRKVHVL
jgi:16S rRNA (uracil1498-N3)-methyltransferase